MSFLICNSKGLNIKVFNRARLILNFFYKNIHNTKLV
jgi:hypothetical protein